MKIEYHNLYSHIILVTRNRYPFIKEEHRQRIEKYMTGVVSNHLSRVYAIYANSEHVHVLISRSPAISEQELAARLAAASAKFIVETGLADSRFAWQESASAFSVSKSDVDKVCKYILNQEAHHRKVTFQEEYNAFMKFYQQTLRYDTHTI